MEDDYSTYFENIIWSMVHTAYWHARKFANRGESQLEIEHILTKPYPPQCGDMYPDLVIMAMNGLTWEQMFDEAKKMVLNRMRTEDIDEASRRIIEYEDRINARGYAAGGIYRTFKWDEKTEEEDNYPIYFAHIIHRIVGNVYSCVCMEENGTQNWKTYRTNHFKYGIMFRDLVSMAKNNATWKQMFDVAKKGILERLNGENTEDAKAIRKVLKYEGKAIAKAIIIRRVRERNMIAMEEIKNRGRLRAIKAETKAGANRRVLEWEIDEVD